MKEIQLTKGQVALIDDEDFDRVSQFKWYANWSKTTKFYYAERIKRKGKARICYSMHRFILGLQKGDKREIDHKNHNTLDNRKSNLRITNKRGNAQNRKNNSRFGVNLEYYPRKNKSNPFFVRIQSKGKSNHIGCFPTLFDAIIARDNALSKIA